MIKKINSILSMITYCVVIIHSTMAALIMCGIIPFSKVLNISGGTLILCFCAHAILSFLIISFNKSDSGRFYFKQNKKTALQRISAILILVFFSFHLIAYRDYTNPSTLSFVSEILMLICIVIHMDISTERAFISLGITCKPLTIIMKILLYISAVFSITGLVLFFFK